jgi:acetate---CoA ligase (ADP-forming)
LCPITGALPSMSGRLAQDLVDVAKTTDKPIFVVWGSPVGDEAAYRDVLLKSDLPVFRTFANAIAAATAYFDYHAFRTRYRSPFARPVMKTSPSAKAGRELLRGDEATSMRLLQEYGIDTPRFEIATSPKEAAKLAEAFRGPVVMKILSPDIVHKSDRGLVRVGVASPDEAKKVFKKFLKEAPEAEGVIVSELVSGGVETVVGISQDDLFGPVVMFGMGGVFVEVLKDVTFRVPPFGKDEARRMLEEVQGAALLHGARGKPKVDRAALVDVIMRVQRMAMDLHAELAELDINPLAALPKGAVALDALAVGNVGAVARG